LRTPSSSITTISPRIPVNRRERKVFSFLIIHRSKHHMP
jgi:hypothetical protein